MKELSSDITMETVYTRNKTKKTKTVFKGVLGKILLSSLALSVATGTIPMSMVEANAYEPVNTAEIQVNEGLTALRNTIEALEDLKADGYIFDESLKDLAKTIDALNASNIDAYEVSVLLDRAEKVIEGVDKDSVNLVKSAIARAKDRFGLNVGFVDSYEVQQAKANNVSFPDVKQGDWYYDNVMSLVGMGAINGYPDGTFAPNNSISYAEYLTILVKTTHAGNGDYSVSSDEAWYNGILRAAYDSDIVKTTEIKDFGAPITRADAAKFTEKAVQKVLGEAEVDTTNMNKLINDYASFRGTSNEYYILQQYGKGIVVGDDKNNFNANSNLTRAEASTIILRTVRPENRRDMSNVNVDDEDDSIVITDDKFYNGRMKTEVATQYDLEALSSARFYRENGRLFISIDLPELPDGFMWRLSAGSYTKDLNDVFYTLNDDYTGVTGHQVIEVVSKFSDRTINDIDFTELSVYIMNNEGKGMVSHRIATNAINQVLRQSLVNSADAEWVSFNTSSIYNW